MDTFNIAENIIRFRNKKKLTQEQLADFVGVTKASVSKWETKKSTPDIALLPRLATFFDVTVDELLGYNPQLSKEQILKLYHEVATDFAECSFEETIEKTNQLVKHYYNCYPFLIKICLLWLNHYTLSKTPERQKEILESMGELCEHIMSDCQDLGTCNDAMIIKAYANLLLGKGSEVIDNLNDTIRPDRLANQSESLLIDAYLLVGDVKKADGLTQLSMYNHLLVLIGNSTKYLMIHSHELDICEETILRASNLIKTYHLENLNPNASGIFYYHAAVIYAMHNQKKSAIHYLTMCSSCMRILLSEETITLHGDDYFTLIEEQFVQFDIDESAPRNRKLIVEDIKGLLNHPAFAVLENEPEYHILKSNFMEVK